MKKHRKLLALLLSAALVLSLFGCSQEPAATNPPATNPPATDPTEPPAEEIYTQAAQPLLDAQNLELKLTVKQTITTGMETFELSSQQELVLSGIGTDALKATRSEELEIGDTYDKFDEYYADGILYTTIYDEYNYQGAMSQEEFMARFAPAVLLDETLYGKISAEEVEHGTLINFNSPAAAENWALPEDAGFVSASGTAMIGTDGSLTWSSYNIEYTQGSVKTSMTVKATAEVSDSAEPAVPADLSAYTEISYIEAPRLYELAVMYLYSTGTASSTITETIASQAAAYTHTAQTVVHFTGMDTDHAADVDYNLAAYQDGEGTSTYTLEEHFENGVYTVSTNGGTPEEDASVNANTMLYYAQDYLGENMPALDYISSAEIEEVGGLLYLDLGLTDTYGDAMNGYVCSMLFGDEAFLNNMASAYETTACDFYLIVDPVTGFPISLGLQYSGTHTIDGTEYVLAVQTDQAFQLANSTTYESITGEPLPDEEPETKATPLFYRVTGTEGQEMYLLGTIHVGDARTAYLPNEIYDALNASDALAVEVDTIAFEEAMTTDTELATKIAMEYVNPDGSATKDLLDEAVYDKAVKLLKASGNYNANVEFMKPYVWSQSIDNFYLAQDFSLQTGKGVDVRLLRLAKEKGMDILEVESGLFQMQLLMGFSTELQLLLLEESVDTTAADYCTDVQMLFEAWCQGDEAVLRELLIADLADLEEAELALYEEYVQAMIIDRNAAMLEVAKGYLESGETVFYAVGLAHLLQENGLVDTLREAGYTVELVNYS